MATGGLPPMILLEDANDIVNFLEYTERTVPRDEWAEDVITAKNNAALRRFAGGLV